MADHFKRLFVTALDRNSSWWYAFLACSRGVGFRLDTLAAITLSFECILVMAVHQRVSIPSAILLLLLFLCPSSSPAPATVPFSSFACLHHLCVSIALHLACLLFTTYLTSFCSLQPVFLHLSFLLMCCCCDFTVLLKPGQVSFHVGLWA